MTDLSSESRAFCDDPYVKVYLNDTLSRHGGILKTISPYSGVARVMKLEGDRTSGKGTRFLRGGGGGGVTGILLGEIFYLWGLQNAIFSIFRQVYWYSRSQTWVIFVSVRNFKQLSFPTPSDLEKS